MEYFQVGDDIQREAGCARGAEHELPHGKLFGSRPSREERLQDVR